MVGINFVYRKCSNHTCSQPRFDEIGADETQFADAVEEAITRELDAGSGMKEIVVAPATNLTCRVDRNWGKS